MSIILERFGPVTLPLLDGEQDIGTDGSQISILQLPGGRYYNANGAGDAPAEIGPINARAVASGATTAALQTTHDALRAYRGKKRALYAQMGDGSVRWRWATLEKCDCQREIGQINWLELRLRFQPDEGGWYGNQHGDGWTLGDGTLLGDGHVLGESGLYTLTGGSGVANSLAVANGGDRRIDDAILTLAVPGGGTAILNVEVKVTGVSRWFYGIAALLTVAAIAGDNHIHVGSLVGGAYNTPLAVGMGMHVVLDSGAIHSTTITSITAPDLVGLAAVMPSAAAIGKAASTIRIAAGQSVVIDCGAGTVTRAGVDDYKHFHLHSTDHKISDWLRLEPGSNTVSVTLNGGGATSTMTFDYGDGWE